MGEWIPTWNEKDGYGDHASFEKELGVIRVREGNGEVGERRLGGGGGGKWGSVGPSWWRG